MQKLPGFINKNLKLLSTVLTSAIIGGATTGVVMAAIPDSSGTIHGCRNNLTRSLTVVDNEAGQSCGLGTTSLNWSQNGTGKSSVVYRGVISNVTVPAGGLEIKDLSPVSWLQQADEIDQIFLYAKATPPGCTINIAPVDEDGQQLYGSVVVGASGFPDAISQTSAYIFEPGTAKTRTLRAQIGSNCDSSVTLDKFQIDIIGTR